MRLLHILSVVVIFQQHTELELPSVNGFVLQKQFNSFRNDTPSVNDGIVSCEVKEFRSKEVSVAAELDKVEDGIRKQDFASFYNTAFNLMASGSFAFAISFGGITLNTASAADDSLSTGFEEFAAKGGVMKTDPKCFFDQCGPQSKACFTNPSCLKGITCLGNCRGEQLCATQCFARFGSEKLNGWLSCTLEEKECVTTGVKQDTSKFYQDPPQTKSMESFKPSDLEGKWYKVLGYNPKYDTYPCQINTFSSRSDGGLDNDILFRVPKPDSEGSWQNNFVETMADSKGPEGLASMTVEGKMFGLTFHEQWYVIGQGANPDWRAVAYIGDTQQGPYDGAFVYTKEKNALFGPDGTAIRDGASAALKEAGLDPNKMVTIDNTCPSDVTKAGVTKEDASKDKLEWNDVFELTEWFRPGTLKKQTDFDPNKM